MNYKAVYPELTQCCKSTRTSVKERKDRRKKEKKRGFLSGLTSLWKKLDKAVRNWSRKEKISFSLDHLRIRPMAQKDTGVGREGSKHTGGESWDLRVSWARQPEEQTTPPSLFLPGSQLSLRLGLIAEVTFFSGFSGISSVFHSHSQNIKHFIKCFKAILNITCEQ